MPVLTVYDANREDAKNETQFSCPVFDWFMWCQVLELKRSISPELCNIRMSALRFHSECKSIVNQV